jgi:hypothetical protein
MASSGMLHRMALVRTIVSEELSASFIRVTRIGKLVTLAITSGSCWLWLTFTDSCHPDDGGAKFLRNVHSVRWLLVTASIVPSSPILVTLMNEAQSSSETAVLTRAT